jgi:hypothetical protein
MSGDWRGTLWTSLVTFCTVIIRGTATFWSPCISKSVLPTEIQKRISLHTDTALRVQLSVKAASSDYDAANMLPTLSLPKKLDADAASCNELAQCNSQRDASRHWILSVSSTLSIFWHFTINKSKTGNKTLRFRDKIGRRIQATTGTPTQLTRKANLLTEVQTGAMVFPKRRVLFAVCFYHSSTLTL